MRRLAVGLLVLLAVAGCVGRSGPAVTSASPSQGAEAVVLGYYKAIAAHDATAATTYLTPAYSKGFASPAAYQAWVANYQTLTHLTVVSRALSGDAQSQHPGYSELAELMVSYEAVLRTPSANEVSGTGTRFVMVGRTGSGPWLIVDIGTGP